MPAHDVLVIGGGIAGISAAISAARLKSKVLLIEKSVNLGGLATSGLISWYEPLCDGTSTQRAAGIAEELLRLAIKNGFDNLPPKWGGKSGNAPRNDRFSTFYSPTFFSIALDEFAQSNGVELLFDTLVTYPVMENNVCKGVIAENTDGRCFFPAQYIIDASGDATIFFRCGAETQDFENYLTYIVHETDYDNTAKYITTHDLSALRRWKNCGSDYLGNGHPANMPLWKGTSSKSITEYMIQGKKRMLHQYVNTDKNEREILSIPTMPQLRVIRRIIGDYTFTGKEKNYVFPDAIGYTGDFRNRDVFYSIPFRCLYNSRFPNLIAAGRIVSAIDEGMEILRVIPCCAITGQAAGTAAGLGVASGEPNNKIPIGNLQSELKKQGSIL